MDDDRPRGVWAWPACLQYLGIPWVWHLMDDVPVQLCRRGGAAIPALAEEFGRQIQGNYLSCSQK